MNIEQQYLSLCKEIIEKGNIEQETRSGQTRSLFGRELRHNFIESNGQFPLLTSKFVSLKNVFTELKWYLLGRTDLKYLVENNCNVWNGDCYKRFKTRQPTSTLSMDEFIDRIKTNKYFSYEYGDMGSIYGKQFRSDDIKGRYDQINNLIKTLRQNPSSRRMLCSLWEVKELENMLLTPCFYSFELYTRKLSTTERLELYYRDNQDIQEWKKTMTIDEYLDSEMFPTRAISMKFNMRSNDMPLGNPYNISLTGMLLMMFGKMVNMIPEELICSIGNAHIYENQVEQMKVQLTRETFELPVLKLNKDEMDIQEDISEFEFSDFELKNYKHSGKLHFELSN